MITIQRYDDRFHPDITEFRRKIILENHADSSFLNTLFSHEETKVRLKHLPSEAVEEVWKFSLSKWRDTAFENLEALFHGEQMVGVSGCRLYENRLLRVAMHLYILKSHRNICRNFLFMKDGVFARHLEFANSLSESPAALFMTVYEHNRKTRVLNINLGTRKLDPARGDSDYLHRLVSWPEKIIFNDVPQSFFFYPLDTTFVFDGYAPKPRLKPRSSETTSIDNS
jgi:hypothetical protein